MTGKKKILLIDDDEAILDHFCLRLGDRYDLVTTSKPLQALGIALSEQPDLILCDIDMPDISGGDLSAWFSRCDGTMHIPFIYLTALVSPSEVDELGGNVGGRPGKSKDAPFPHILKFIEQALQH